MYSVGLVAQAALLHRLVGLYSVLEEPLIALFRLDLALQSTHHERVRRLTCAPRESFHARFEALRELQASGGDGHQ